MQEKEGRFLVRRGVQPQGEERWEVDEPARGKPSTPGLSPRRITHSAWQRPCQSSYLDAFPSLPTRLASPPVW